jgi:hypothetical protein
MVEILVKKIFFLFIVLFVFIGCKSSKNKIAITEGIQYSAYDWRHKELSDSTYFCLALYIGIKKNGDFVNMRNLNCKKNGEYFEGSITDSICELINTIINKNDFKNTYANTLEDTIHEIYSGFTYCIDYTKKGIRERIQFIPNKSPQELKNLSLKLDNLIYLKSFSKSDTLNLESYKNELEQIFIKECGKFPSPTPPPPKN